MVLVRAAFGQRRKMLRRSLAGRVSPAAFAAAGVAPDDRPEQLGVEAWGRLAEAVLAAPGAGRAKIDAVTRDDSPETMVLTAPAKLTLRLRVTGVRADGYHLIDAEMVTLDLADTLVVGPGDGLEIVDATTGAGLAVTVDDDNLVRRALALVGRTAHVRLEKRDTGRRRAGGRLGRRCRRAAVGGRRRSPRCGRAGRRRAVLRGRGPGQRCPASARWWSRCPSWPGPSRCSPRPSVAPPRPSTGRGTTWAVPRATTATTSSRRPWWLSPAWPSGVTACARSPGRRPRLAGSGSTWFVEGAFPGEDRIVVHTVPAG